MVLQYNAKNFRVLKYPWTLRLGVYLFIYFALFLHKFIYCNAQLIRCAHYGYFPDHFRHLNVCLSHTWQGVISGRTGIKRGKTAVRGRFERWQEEEQWGAAPARTVTHKGSKTDHEGVSGIMTSFLLQGSTINSHCTPAQFYSSKNNRLVHWSWQCNDIQILNSNTTF